ncbi:hypothetical protein GIB67_031215 [Kingdonia uniflora]|uniref:Uncharacterized protein n=1 Tax=Kingdonia uniflora TaxID=39325 RepID=A0A7J7NL08_9MAGN|nr:hypothetical protein GIB67_031215 [Kingdonia uniflora]
MIEARVVIVLLGAFGSEGVAEETASAVTLLVRQTIGAEHVAKEEIAVTHLINMLRRGTPKGKENVVAALLKLCRGGGALTTQRVLKGSSIGKFVSDFVVYRYQESQTESCIPR